MNKKSWIAYVILALVAIESNAQKNYTLDEIVQLARTQSPAWARAETRKENNYWQYKTYLSDYQPQLSLDGTLPNYVSNFIPVTQEDGTVEYRSVKNNTVDARLGLSQSIGATGATVYAASSLSRFDDLSSNTQRYNGQPIQIGFVQPIFQFNQLAWNRRINPLEYEESQKAYFEELEQISLISTQVFFDLMLAQIEMEIAKLNVANNDTIYKIALGRYQLGKIGENELLQLELNLVNSQLAVSQAEVDLQSAGLNLKSYVGLAQGEQILLQLPEEMPQFEVDENVALAEALKNRQDPVSFARRIYQGQEAVARAKGTTGVNMDLFASYGISNSGQQIGDVYNETQNSQIVRLDMSVPILDWGRQKSRKKTAEANLKLIEYQVEQDKLTFEQDVITQVRNFKMLREQVEARKKSDEIGLQAYQIAYQLYLIGKISITDLNQSLASKDQAKQQYIASLRDFWTAYYQLREKTLYDFETNTLLLRDLQTK
jgi:outer membrane protein TolC